MINISFITQKIHAFCEKEWLFHSRVQALSSFSSEKVNVFAKREDDSGFGISGTKKRKYASLISFILMKNPDNVRIIGGENSNNIVGLLQVLHEYKIETFCYIKKQKGKTLTGNGFLFHLLAKPENIIYIQNEDWGNVNEIAEQDAKQSEQTSFIVREGASQREAVAGASTLMLDILRNETEKQLFFDHIFIDSGTGLMAAALANMNFLLGGKSHIHVVHTTGNETSFLGQLFMCQSFMQDLLETNINFTEKISHYFPETAKSFGAVNTTILRFIRELAQAEGILTDPIYTAKLFFSAKKIIERKSLTGNILLIHGGGGTGLMGFSEEFSRFFQTL